MYYILVYKGNTAQQKATITTRDEIGFKNICLASDEIAENSAIGKTPEAQKANMGYFATSPVTISIKNKETDTEKRNFIITDNSTGLFTLQLSKCNIYVVRRFGFDTKNSKILLGYKEEIWEYDYEGKGEPLLLLSEKPKEYISYYWATFRVSPLEQHISLVRGHGGRDDYALIVKDLQTLADVFVLPVADIAKRNPDIGGDIDFQNGGWTTDGRYFWFGLGIAADVYGLVRVDSKDWTYEVFPVLERTMWGDAFNMNAGVITYGENVAPWTGVEEMDQQLQKEALEAGQISSFYVYNLFTKQKYLIATTTDPTYFFRPYWLSDTELQYELPTGEKKIYKISKR